MRPGFSGTGTIAAAIVSGLSASAPGNDGILLPSRKQSLNHLGARGLRAVLARRQAGQR